MIHFLNCLIVFPRTLPFILSKIISYFSLTRITISIYCYFLGFKILYSLFSFMPSLRYNFKFLQWGRFSFVIQVWYYISIFCCYTKFLFYMFLYQYRFRMSSVIQSFSFVTEKLLSILYKSSSYSRITSTRYPSFDVCYIVFVSESFISSWVSHLKSLPGI